MTSLSQYMRAEQPDYSEEASFYVAGAEGWGDPRLRALRLRQRGYTEAEEERLYPTPESWDEDEDC